MQEGEIKKQDFNFNEEESKVDTNILNKGKDTEAESVISNYANSIRTWGAIVAWISFTFNFIMAFVMTVITDSVFTFFLWLSLAVLVSLIIYFFAKLIWASIMLFVNISTTLKRIEIRLEQNSTC